MGLLPKPRSELQTLLEAVLESENVYFQPPDSIQMKYPAIVYGRSNIRTNFADNGPYKLKRRYQITVIDPDPDSEIPDKVALLPTVSYDRFFASNSLNHDVFSLFF